MNFLPSRSSTWSNPPQTIHSNSLSFKLSETAARRGDSNTKAPAEYVIAQAEKLDWVSASFLDMADFGQSTRTLSPVADFKHAERTTSLFFPSPPLNLKDDSEENIKNNKNGCGDCLDRESPKSKINSTQENTVLDQHKTCFTTENSMFHDFSTSSGFWSPPSTVIDDGFVPVNGVHFPQNTPAIAQPRRIAAPTITTTVHQQHRRPPHNGQSPYITATKPVHNITSPLNSVSAWNQHPHSMSGWPQQHISTGSAWGHRISNPNMNTIALSHARSSSRPSSLTLAQTRSLRGRGNSFPSSTTRPPLSSMNSMTQSLQSMSLNGQHHHNHQPVDGTILDDMNGFGNSQGHSTELSNSLYPYQVIT